MTRQNPASHFQIPWRSTTSFILLLLFSISHSSAAEPNSLMAAVEVVDITPPPGVVMYGFFPRIKNSQPATGTLDPLYARVLVLAAGQKRLALVTLDLGRTFGPSLLNELQEHSARHDNISGLVVTASHTHASPNIVDDYPPGQTPPWETAAIQKIEAAIADACQHLAPVRVGVGYGSVSIGYNRRRVNADGTVTMLWSNPTKVPTSPVDPTVGVIRIDRMDSSPLAILVNYACHPVIIGEDVLEYSADFPGVMTKAVETAFQNKPVAMFLQGAAGDINPYDADSTLVNGSLKARDWTGQQLASEAIEVARGIQTKADPDVSLQFSEDVLTIPVRWDAAKFRDGLLAAYGPKIFEDHATAFAHGALKELHLPVTTVLIDKQFALVGLPGEPFVELQMDLRFRSPVANTFLLGYTNGYFDYFPTIKAASEGEYGAGDSDTYVAVGAGELMINQAIIRLYGLLGKWSDLPDDLGH